MALAEVTRLAPAASPFWPAFSQRLREIGFDRDWLRGAQERVPQLQVTALHWATLDDPSPAAAAARMLMLRQPEEAAPIFGEALLGEAAALGLVVPNESTRLWRFPFSFEIVNGLYIVSDPPGDEPECVMAVGGTTQLLAAASYPQNDIDSALDLGCGCGVLALLLAGSAKRVVATDINPRALQFARINAAINGIDNIDFRAGSLYQPVEDERFDLIVSQPPFYSRGDSAETVWYLHGGERGDELALQILAGAHNHLTPDGVAFLLADFPCAEEPLVSRIRTAAPNGGLVAAVLDTPVESIIEMATLASASGDESALRAAKKLHAQLQLRGVALVEQAVIALSAESSWTREIRVPAGCWHAIHRQHFDTTIALEKMSPSEFRAARLTWTPGVETCIRALAENSSETIFEFRPPADNACLGALRTSEAGQQSITAAVVSATPASDPQTEDLLRAAVRAGVLCFR